MSVKKPLKKPAKKIKKTPRRARHTMTIETNSKGFATKVVVDGVQIVPSVGTASPAFQTKCHQNADGSCTVCIFDGTRQIGCYATTGPCLPGCAPF